MTVRGFPPLKIVASFVDYRGVNQTHLSAQLLSAVFGLLIPLAVAAMTKINAPRPVKTVVNAGLAAITGSVATAATAGSALGWQQWVLDMAITWITSISTYYGFHSPLGTTGTIAQATAGFGVGGAAGDETPVVPSLPTPDVPPSGTVKVIDTAPPVDPESPPASPPPVSAPPVSAPPTPPPTPPPSPPPASAPPTPPTPTPPPATPPSITRRPTGRVTPKQTPPDGGKGAA